MAKELIVSVNGREKKIAIIENDQVTEFYIERGEENQGIVGNIYKGGNASAPRNASAFVDVGLERDAFSTFPPSSMKKKSLSGSLLIRRNRVNPMRAS